MPLAVSPEDEAIFRSYLSGVDLPAQQRLAALDNPAPMPAPEPDLRLADNRRYNRTPEQMSDVPAPVPQVAVARGDDYTRQALQSWPGAEMPPEPAQPAAAQQPAPLAAPAGQPQPSRSELVQAGVLPGDIETYIWQGARGSVGQFVPEHEQKQGYQREFTAPVDRTRVEDAYAAQGEAERNRDLAGAGQLALEQDAASQRKRAAAADLAEFQMRQQAAEEELGKREQDYQQLLQNSKVDPNVWRRRDTGDALLTAIGGLLMGLGGSADRFIDMLEKDREHAQEERDTELKGAQSMLDDFRRRVMSPEAAAGYENALKARIVAEDLRVMAAQTGSVEASSAAELNARKMETYAAEQEAAAKAREAGAISEKVAVIPGRTVGGSAGGLQGVVDRMKKLGYSNDQITEYLSRVNVPGANFGLPQGGKSLTPTEQLAREKDERERIVKLPDGRRVYATNEGTAKEVQGLIKSADTFIKQGELLKSLTQSASTRAWGAKEAERAESVLVDMAAVYKDMKKLGTYDDGVAKLITDGIGNPSAFFRNPSAVAKVQQAIDNARQEISQATSFELYEDPGVKRPAASTDAELGFEPGGG